MGSVTAYGQLVAPELVQVDSLYLTNSGSSLPSLHTVRELKLAACAATPGLRRAPDLLWTQCTLDLRQVSAVPEQLRLEGWGGVLLPDPYPGSLLLLGALNLNLSTVQGGLIVRVRPTDAHIQHVAGNVSVEFSGDELGTLTELESIGKDLNYCVPDMPTETLNAWLATLQIGGQANNTCG